MKTPVFINPFYKPSNTILVAGSGRSGTTWLGNVIGSCSGFLSLFEPFDYRHVPRINTSCLRPYIRPDCRSHHLDKTIEDILMGRIRNDWIMEQNRRKVTWRIIIKEIRANLFLGYIKKKFKNPIVFVIRHPCAVVLSRMKKKWETHIDTFLEQQELMEDYLYPFEGLMRDCKAEIEKHAIMWSIENLIPFKQLKNEEYIFCTYENLVTKKEELERIFTLLDLSIPYGIDDTISKPTNVSSNKDKSYLIERENLQNWKSELSKYEIRTVLDIVHSFGIDLYTSDITPYINESES